MMELLKSTSSLVKDSLLRFLKPLWLHQYYPPGPVPLPVIGGLWRVGYPNEGTLIKLAKHYGNVFTLWVSDVPMVVLSGFDAVKEAIIEHADDFSERPITPFIAISRQGRGILFGRNWKHQRRFGLATMRKLGLGKRSVEHDVIEVANQLVEFFAQTKGQPVDPTTAITKATSHVICAFAFGKGFSLDDENLEKLLQALNCGLKFGMTLFHGLYELFPEIMDYLPGPHKKALAHLEIARSIAREEIRRHKTYESHEPLDFIDFYLLQIKRTKDDPETIFDEENLVEIILEFFGAGTDTTSATMMWAIFLMGLHQDVQEKVYREMEDTFDSSHFISYQDRNKLPYTYAVIHEIMRSDYILKAGVPRETVKDVKILGVHIPKGAFIVPDMWSVLQDPKQWETPKAFNPNHFLDKDGKFVPREEFVAFGAGARACLGELLARVELFIFFTSLMRTFRFHLPKGKTYKKPPFEMIMHPRRYKICAIPRSNITLK